MAIEVTADQRDDIIQAVDAMWGNLRPSEAVDIVLRELAELED